MTDIKGVSVVGLGKLGLPMAVCYASKGYRVTGVDTNPNTVNLVSKGRSPISEPGLPELLDTTRDHMSATDDCKKAMANSEITFIIVPTPSEEEDTFSLKYVLDACEKIGDALHEKSDYHLVVLVSTVMPGATLDKVRPLLEARSDKKCGRDFGLCYSPEFIALGTIIHNIFNPDFILIGESDQKSGSILESFYQTIADNSHPMLRINTVNAEIAKLSINSYVSTKITYANMLAGICERIEGANVDVVTKAMGLDSRIGPKFLKGTLGFGGPCFPRDQRVITRLAAKLHVPATIAQATTELNSKLIPMLLERIKRLLPDGGRVGILGLAYKPATDQIIESQGLKLAQTLAASGTKVIAYNPNATDNAKAVLGDSISFASSADECVRRSDLVVITIPCPQFSEINIDSFASENSNKIIIDCWRILDADKLSSVTNYFPIGVGAQKAG